MVAPRKIDCDLFGQPTTKWLALAQMIDERSVLELQDRLDAEHKADKAALKRVLQLLSKHKGKSYTSRPAPHHLQNEINTTNVSVAVNGHQRASDPNGTESKVLGIISNLDSTFTFDDLKKKYEQETGSPIDRKLLSWVIFRNKDKHIQVVQPGRGQRKAIYAKMS